MEKIDDKSLDIREDSIEKLKQLFPEIITEGEQINFEKLKAILTDELDESNEKYTFTWNGKAEAMKIANTPTSGTLKPVLEKSREWGNTENLYLEGDNLEVLKLLQKSYSNKIKTIYIDPPYNTGSDFVYNDKFSDSLENYLSQTGQLDQEGYRLSTNQESSGRFHSNWLNMMYPRLKLARNLLKDDGAILISIDDHELANLIKICNEIFGENNFVGCISRATGTTTGQDSSKIGSSLDYCVIYSKSSDFTLNGIPLSEKDAKRFNLEDEKGKFSILQLRKTGNADTREERPNMFYPVTAPNGEEVYPFGPTEYLSRWRVGKETYNDLVQQDMIYWKKNNNNELMEIDGYKESEWVPYVKYYLEGRTKKISNLLVDIEGNKKASITIKELFNKNNYFDNPKPLELLKILISISSDKDDIILDFFSGSATTAHATMQLNAEDNGGRKYIMVQLPEKLGEDSNAYKDGYDVIPDIAVERIIRAGDKILKENPGLKDELDIGFKYFELDKSNIKKWNIDEDNLEEELLLFTDNFEEGSTHDDIVYELLLKQGIELTVPIEKKTSEETSIYIIANGAMFVVIGNNIDESIGEYIRDYESMFNQDEDSEIVVAFQDIGFEDDSAKLNTFEILKAAGFKDENIFTI